MTMDLKGIVTQSPENGALQFLESGDSITPIFEDNFNGDHVNIAMYIDEVLCENRSFEGLLTAMYDEDNGYVDETIIVMENDGSIDDITDLLLSSLGKTIRLVIKT